MRRPPRSRAPRARPRRRPRRSASNHSRLRSSGRCAGRANPLVVSAIPGTAARDWCSRARPASRASPSSATRQRRCASSDRRRGRYRAGRLECGRRSASDQTGRTNLRANAPNRRCRCRHAAGHRPRRPRRRRLPKSRRDCAPDSRDCGSADESSTGPRTTCRNPASSSWRTGWRRPRAAAQPAAHHAAPASTRPPPCRPASVRRAVAILSLTVAGTPSRAPIGSPFSQRRF